MQQNDPINNIANSQEKSKILNINGIEIDMKPIDMNELENFEINYLVDELFIENQIIFLSGSPGVGKSTLALQLAECISKGKPFLNRQTLKRPVLYFTKSVEVNRVFLKNLLENSTIDLSSFPIYIDANPLLQTINNCEMMQHYSAKIAKIENKLSEKYNKKLIKQKDFYTQCLKECHKKCNLYIYLINKIRRETKLDPVLFFDSYQSFIEDYNIDINDNLANGSFITNTLKAFRDAGTTIFVIHHPAKNIKESQGSKGAAKIKESADLFLFLNKSINEDDEDITNDTNRYTLTTLKSRAQPAYTLYLIKSSKTLIFNDITKYINDMPYAYFLKFIQMNCSSTVPISKANLIKSYINKYSSLLNSYINKNNINISKYKLIETFLNRAFEDKFILYEYNTTYRKKALMIKGITASCEKFLNDFFSTINEIEDEEIETEVNIDNTSDNTDNPENENKFDDIISFKPAQSPQKKEEHKPRNPNCRKCAPGDCKFFEEENRYFCYYFRTWCDSVTEGRQ